MNERKIDREIESNTIDFIKWFESCDDLIIYICIYIILKFMLMLLLLLYTNSSINEA